MLRNVKRVRGKMPASFTIKKYTASGHIEIMHVSRQ